MSAGIQYTAVYKGQEHTLSVRYWGLLVTRSPTFIRKHLAIAEDKGMDKNAQMQYAIEQDKCYGTRKIGTRIVRDKKINTAQDKENIKVKEYRSVLYNMANRG